MKTYTRNEAIELLQQNNINQKKAKYSNDILIQMLQTLNEDTTFTVEPTRGKFAMNRGSLCESIVKCALGLQGVKSNQNKVDIDLKGIDNKKFGLPTFAKKLEVKFATTFAPASENLPTTKNVLLVCADGVYNIETQNHKGRYTNNSIFDGVRNDVLSNILGF